jgi:ATP-binding protein involved in chromosome partitioning
MVKSIEIGPAGDVRVSIYLTVAGCPMRDQITREVTAAVTGVTGVTSVDVVLDVMSAEQRQQLQTNLRAESGVVEKEIPFAKPSSLTRVYAVASGKGGVGKSSRDRQPRGRDGQARAVGRVVDADIYGHSIRGCSASTGGPPRSRR